MPGERDRLADLDALRGIAVLMVLAFHYTTRFGELFPRWAWGGFALGAYGVHLFFVISGFVIFMTLERSAHASDFLVARFSRLYPAYWSAVLITSAALALFAGALAPPSPAQAAVNLTMLQGFVGVPSVDGVYWSLEVELLFYALALAALRLRLLDRAELLVAGWLALSALFCSPLAEGLPGRGLLVRLLDLEFAPFFALGILFYRRYRRRGPGRWNAALLAVAFALVALRQPPLVAATIAAGAVVLAMLAHGGLPFLRAAPLVFFGTISYSLYLLHQKIGYAVVLALAERGWTPAARLAAATAASIALATALTFLVERPAMRAIRRRRAARRSAVPLAARPG